MTWFVIFLCIMFFGLGYFTRDIAEGIKFLDNMIERRKQEDKKLTETFRKTIQQVSNELMETSKVVADLETFKKSLKK